MGAAHPDSIDLVVQMSDPAARAEAASQLAARCKVEEFLVLVRDPELGALVPAPGFAQTLPGGPSWRALLRRCATPGRYAERVEYPPGRSIEALCLVPDGIAALLLGGSPDPDEVRTIERLLPMLSRMLGAEQQALFAAAAERAAREAASRVQALADALEAARAEHARLNARLRGEHRRKDAFLAMLAHELRNPLTPLVTTIELIRRGGGIAGVKHLEIMSRQVRQLSRLVEDLLDVSRVSRGRIELRRQPQSLSEVVADALESSRPLLDGRRHSVRLLLPEEPILVDADNVRLTQVFANLLHNAGKYTDPGGSIEVEVGRAGDSAFVRVEDNGQGIDPAMIEQVFELFTQAPMSLARAQGGLGIGLTLVRALVELHGGSVEARSPGPGKGSTFTVRLPIAQPGAVRAPAPAGPEHAAHQALRVLIVDDNEDAASSLGDILRLQGHHAEIAFSGLKALQIAPDMNPDLVLLDIGLPEMDGYEVARRLRRALRPDARVVAVTGYGADEDRRLSREAGFDEHVVKPVMPETMAGILRRARRAPTPVEGS